MERLQTGQDRSSTSKVSRLKTVPTGQRYAMGMPSYFSSLSRFNAKKPSLYQHDMQRKTILAFRRIVHFRSLILLRLFEISWGDEARPKVVSQQEIKARAALDSRGLLGYH